MKLFIKQKFKQKNQEPLKNQNRFVLQNGTFVRFLGNVFILLIITCVISITVTMRDSLIQHHFQNLKTALFEYSTAYGFGINDIIVEGREKTTLEALNEQVKLNRTNSILDVNLHDLKARLEALPWIEKAELKRTYFPNVLQIFLKEKEIIALYQSNGKFYPVDKYGHIIDADYIPRAPLLIIVGEGAPEKLFELLSVVQSDSDLFPRIKAAVLHSSRRWDLIFDDLEHGITVKFPEKGLSEAWKKLIKINNKYGIFKRKLTFIDLRYENKVTVNIAD